METTPVRQAAQAILAAEALLITAGAGMGVDSGLPDFRGVDGFWKAYPLYAKLGLNLVDLANPEWFEKDPEFAWGFYGHRLNLYRATIPHDGFHILRRWAKLKRHGAYVFTSNIDGAFQAAQFPQDTVTEVHGSVLWMQCYKDCGIGIFSGEKIRPVVDPTTLRARQPLPKCPNCGALARPNILMFGDQEWDGRRSLKYGRMMNVWLQNVEPEKLLIIECGAGTAIPTVRLFSEQTTRLKEGRMIRINTREPEVPDGQISLPLGALDALTAIDRELVSLHAAR